MLLIFVFPFTGSGIIHLEILRSKMYYIAVSNLNSEEVEVIVKMFKFFSFSRGCEIASNEATIVGHQYGCLFSLACVVPASCGCDASFHTNLINALVDCPP